jgi:hypothetical protein
MKKSTWGFIILIVILLIAVVTNPKIETHKQEVKAKLNSKLQGALTEQDPEMDKFEKAGYNLGVLLGSSLVDKVIDNSITCDSYILFSITKITWKGESRAIGYGVLGNVFLSSKIDEAFANGMSNEMFSETDVEVPEPIDYGN